MKFVRSLAIGLSFSLLFSGCSLFFSNEAKKQAEKAKSPPPLPKVSWNFEEIMMHPPGKFAGDKYNYIEVRKELDKFPKGLSKEQYYEKLIQMFGENYKPSYVQIKNFDPSINIQIPKPDETIKLPDGKTPQQLNVEIVLDSSGSMNEQIDGMTKMVVAKQAIQNFLASLPENANVSLRVYGHKGSSSKQDKALSCSSNELVYPLGPYNKEQFSKH